MKSRLLFLALITFTLSTHAAQAHLYVNCENANDYPGIHKAGSTHEVDIENPTDQTQMIHIKLTNAINGPWQPTIKEWDQPIAPHTCYHSKYQHLFMHFHSRDPFIWIQTVTTEISGFATQQMQKQCYYRVLKD